MATSININKKSTYINVVENYAALPPANLNSSQFYWVKSSTGTKWLPGNLGGSYRQLGLYFSDGTTWTFTPVPNQATQAEVDAGIINDKFVTPLTLMNDGNKQNNLNIDGTGKKYPTVDAINSYGVIVDLRDAQVTDFAFGYSYRIDSITDVIGTPVTTITANGLPYTLGTNIIFNSLVEVTVDISSIITLNITRV